jgi:AcrR family transcriptional regulator
LLKAAETVLERDGLAGLTLRAVAREAGVSHAAPTHHFGDLTGLVRELAAIGFRQFNAAMAVAGSIEGSGLERRWPGPRPMSPMRRRIPACTG